MSSTPRGLGIVTFLLFVALPTLSAATLPGLLDRVEIIMDVDGVTPTDAATFGHPLSMRWPPTTAYSS